MDTNKTAIILLCSGLAFLLLGVVFGYLLPFQARSWANKSVVIKDPYDEYYAEWVSGKMRNEVVELYFFNITNLDDFLLNDIQPIVEEVGPYVYETTTEKVGVTFQNAIVNYKLWPKQTFAAERSNGSQDDIIVQLSEVWLKSAFQAPKYNDLAMVSSSLVPKLLLDVFAALDATAGDVLIRQNYFLLPDLLKTEMEELSMTCSEWLTSMGITVSDDMALALCDESQPESFLYSGPTVSSDGLEGALLWYSAAKPANSDAVQAYARKKTGQPLAQEDVDAISTLVSNRLWTEVVGGEVLHLTEDTRGSAEEVRSMVKYAQFGALALTSPRDSTTGEGLAADGMGSKFGVNTSSWPADTTIEYTLFYNTKFLPQQNIQGYSRVFAINETEALYNVLTTAIDDFMPKVGGTFDESVDPLMRQLYASQVREMLFPFNLTIGPLTTGAENEDHNMKAFSAYVTHLAHVSYTVAYTENCGLVAARTVQELVRGFDNEWLGAAQRGLFPEHSTADSVLEDRLEWQHYHKVGTESDADTVREWVKLHTFNTVPFLFFPNTTDKMREVQGLSDEQFPPKVDISVAAFDPAEFNVEIFVPEFLRPVTFIYTESESMVDGIHLNRFSPPDDFFNVSRYNNLEYGAVFDGLYNVTMPRNYPAFYSWPHFMHAEVNFTTAKGLVPNSSKHTWWLDVEPVSGTIVRSKKVYQFSQQALFEMTSNLYPNLQTYNATILPYYWIAWSSNLTSDILDDYKSNITSPRQIGVILLILLEVTGGIVFILGVLLLYKEHWEKRYMYQGALVLEDYNDADDLSDLGSLDMVEQAPKSMPRAKGKNLDIIYE